MRNVRDPSVVRRLQQVHADAAAATRRCAWWHWPLARWCGTGSVACGAGNEAARGSTRPERQRGPATIATRPTERRAPAASQGTVKTSSRRYQSSANDRPWNSLQTAHEAPAKTLQTLLYNGIKCAPIASLIFLLRALARRQSRGRASSALLPASNTKRRHSSMALSPTTKMNLISTAVTFFFFFINQEPR